MTRPPVKRASKDNPPSVPGVQPAQAVPVAPDEAWLAEAATVTPLGQPRPGKPPPLRLNRAQRDALRDAVTLPPAPALAPQALRIVSSTPERLAGHVANFDLKLFRDLSEGRLAYEAMVDLHGMYEGDAYLHLINWLQEAHRQDVRCALVICGKGRGYGPGRAMGLLKAQLAGWLANHPAVLAFHTAVARDGGGGAVYVYLRRVRY